MTGESKWEQEKRARRSLRGRQRALRHSFLRDIQKLPDNRWWDNLSGGFSKALEQDAQLDPQWIDTERYPLALYNLFTALGFEVWTGAALDVAVIKFSRFALIAGGTPAFPD